MKECQACDSLLTFTVLCIVLWTNGNTELLSLYSFDRKPILSPGDLRARLSTLHPVGQKGFTRSMSCLPSSQMC